MSDFLRDSLAVFGGDKMWHHAERVVAWKNGVLPYPVAVELDLCSACNHRCPGCQCARVVNKNPKLLDIEVARKVIDDIAECGVRSVLFSGGGEPLAYGEKNVIDLMKRVRWAGMECGLITNGSLMKSDEYLGLCEFVRVSLDAYDGHTFNAFHGMKEREFDRVVANIKRIGAAKFDGHRGDLGIGFLTTSGSVALDDVINMSRFVSQIPGVNYLQFRPLIINDSSQTKHAFDLDEFLSQLQYAIDIYSRHDFKIIASIGKYKTIASSDSVEGYEKCWGSFLQCAIASDGMAYLCCHQQGNNDFCLGDVAKDGFVRVWHSEQARSVRNGISPKSDCPIACHLHQQNRELEKIITCGVKHVNFI